MSPLKIEILLHYYCCVDDYRDLDAPAIKEAIEEFVELGILTKCVGGGGNKYYGNHEALEVYVQALLQIPLPKRVWTINIDNQAFDDLLEFKLDS